MALIQINAGQGKHLTAEERNAQGRLVRPATLYYPGDVMPVQEAEAVQLRKDTKRFTDKGS